MKHFIIEITYRVPFEKLETVVPAHRAYLSEGYKKGLLLVSGPQNPRTGGIVVAKANNENEIKDFFSKDPYCTGNLADYRFIEFTPVSFNSLLESWIG
jgi:uncharacterized protein YciI